MAGRWKQAGGNNEIAKVRAGYDVCMAVVSGSVASSQRLVAYAHVNYDDPKSLRHRGWSSSRDYYDRATARRDALRACGRMLRELNK